MKIQVLEKSQIDIFLQHMVRHFKEYGFEGRLTQPFSVDEPWDSEGYRRKLNEGLTAPLADGKWIRVWVLVDENQISGHLDLHGNGMPALRHRAQFGMGLEEKCRGQGWGRKLMQEALNWCRNQNSLSWVDLNVFAYNKPAVALYQSMGFVEVGRVVDRLRVLDRGTHHSIDDLHLTFNLRPISGDKK